MKTKLKSLEVTKVDAVDAGANPDAHIKLFKKKDGPADNAGSIPEGDQTETLIKRITKAVTDLFKPASGNVIEKREEAESFGEKINEVQRRKIVDEMWDLCYALHSSLVSIMIDDDLESTLTSSMMQQSISEFSDYISSAVEKWSSGTTAGIVKKGIENVTENDVFLMEYARDRVDKAIQKAKEQVEKSKGELEDMIKIDKSKMSPVEAAAYEEIVKKYGVDTEVQDPPEDVNKAKKVNPEKNEDEIEDEVVTEKEKKKSCAKSASATEDNSGDIYKGLHPAVKAEMEALRKFREDAETEKLTDVAKKYELIGKKPEELVPMLKSLKAAGGTAYNDMLSVLDTAVAMSENSGIFSSVGKSGSRYQTSIEKSSAEAKAETIAKGYMEKDPGLGYTDAVAKVWENNPDLMAEYEEEAGF